MATRVEDGGWGGRWRPGWKMVAGVEGGDQASDSDSDSSCVKWRVTLLEVSPEDGPLWSCRDGRGQ